MTAKQQIKLIGPVCLANKVNKSYLLLQIVYQLLKSYVQNITSLYRKLKTRSWLDWVMLHVGQSLSSGGLWQTNPIRHLVQASWAHYGGLGGLFHSRPTDVAAPHPPPHHPLTPLTTPHPPPPPTTPTPPPPTSPTHHPPPPTPTPNYWYICDSYVK